MVQRILIDMIKLRSAMVDNPSLSLPEAFYYPSHNDKGLKPIRELATFRYTCRKCEEAPCIIVCPAEALEKDQEGVVTRHTNLCISCKSCVTICPFGTIMTDFFRHHRNKDLIHDLNDETEMVRFVSACPEGTASITEMDESPENHIFRLNDKVLIKEYLYAPEKQ